MNEDNGNLNELAKRFAPDEMDALSALINRDCAETIKINKELEEMAIYEIVDVERLDYLRKRIGELSMQKFLYAGIIVRIKNKINGL